MKRLIAELAFGIGGSVAIDADFVAAESLRKLSVAGMQLTDEAHYRFVYG